MYILVAALVLTELSVSISNHLLVVHMLTLRRQHGWELRWYDYTFWSEWK